MYFLSAWTCLRFPEPLFENHCFFAVVFKGDWKNLHSSPLVKLFGYNDPFLIRYLQTCLPCMEPNASLCHRSLIEPDESASYLLTLLFDPLLISFHLSLSLLSFSSDFPSELCIYFVSSVYTICPSHKSSVSVRHHTLRPLNNL